MENEMYMYKCSKCGKDLIEVCTPNAQVACPKCHKWNIHESKLKTKKKKLSA
jgi:DNA-directed RNA polymerase subunit RPC12/RpoP